MTFGSFATVTRVMSPACLVTFVTSLVILPVVSILPRLPIVSVVRLLPSMPVLPFGLMLSVERGLTIMKNLTKKKVQGMSLSVPEKHQLRIARDTMKMSDIGARVMGGMSKDDARAVILRLTGKIAIEG